MSKGKYYLGLDQGTTGETALIFDADFRLISKGYREHHNLYPQPGWVEHDAIEILNSAISAVDKALYAGHVSISDIACIGIDHEGESVVAWDKSTGKPIYNAIVWADKRQADYCENLKKQYGDFISDKTGVMVDSYFSATKISWILDNVQLAHELEKENKLLVGNIDAWLMWNFSGGRIFNTDYSTASRTMLFNINENRWDEDILKLFNIPDNILPTICESSGIRGQTDPEHFLGAAVPIAGGCTDQVAALFGQACISKGNVKTTYGTSGVMLMNTGDTIIRSNNGLLTTIGWSLKGNITYALDGSFYTAGAATQWLRDGLEIIEKASDTEKIAFNIGENGDVYFVPAFSGLAAPNWDPYARGTIIGITGGTKKAHIIRATLESTAYQVKDIFDAMEQDGNVKISSMKVDGGATANNFLMQFQSDILGVPIEVPEIMEATALGAAYFAAIGLGDYASENFVEKHWKVARRFEPQMSEDERDHLMYKWHRAVSRAQGWIERGE